MPLGAVRKLPWAAEDVVPALPQRIRPPRHAPSVLDDPIYAAVAALETGGRGWVLSAGDGWRTVPMAGDDTTLAISPGGTRLAVANHARTDFGIVLHDLVRGTSRRIPLPDDFSSWDFYRLRWADENHLQVEDLEVMGAAYDGAPGDSRGRGSWRVIAATGTTVAYRSERQDPSWGQATDDDGNVAGVRHGRRTTVVVADRASSVIRERLLVEEHGVLGRGLSVLALCSDGTLLLRAMERSSTGLLRVVAWHPERRSLEAVASTTVVANIVFAEDVLGGAVAAGDGRWDPRNVDELPAAPADAVAALPTAITPPASAPALTSAPIAAAVAVVERRTVAFLLAPDGTWRSLPLAVDHPQVALSPLGRRLMVTAYASPDVTTVHDLATATRRRVEPTKDRLTGGSGHGRHELQSFDARGDLIAGTLYAGGHFRVVVLDRSDRSVVDELRLGDHEGNYSNWGLRVLAVQRDGTILLRVAAIGPDRQGFRVVAWDRRQRSLRVASVVDVPIEHTVGFATALLRS